MRERGRVSDDDPSPLNLRKGPSTNYDPPIWQIPVGVFFVLEGPECSPRYSWNRVEYRGDDDDLLVGWVAEAMPTFTLWRPIRRGNEFPEQMRAHFWKVVVAGRV